MGHALPFLAHNHEADRQVQELEHKARRQDVLVDDELIHAFYDQQAAGRRVQRRQLERWYRDEASASPSCCT
jgi:ATP-dependent helicase HrpA